ncbi:MAG: EamA family transporter [Bacteroidota bacterium]
MIVATAFWGGSFLLTKLALQHISTTAFIFLRFAVAALFMLPSLVWYSIPLKRQTVMQGIQLGLLQVGMMFLQTIGLQTISPTLSAFLSGFFIVFVLFIRFIMQGMFPSIIDLLSSLLCLAGLALLTHSYGLGWKPGVLYTLGCALFWLYTPMC